MTKRAVLIVGAVAALLAALTLRMLGPSDLWDQTQPKTVSYTTDILVHGRWILPIERGEFPATKPPLYNWLAAPFVKLAGFTSEWAHKAPSILALIIVWAATVWLGSRIDRESGKLIGWFAGLAIPANYMFFKLGYLARPDMLLTLWLWLGWMACTAALLNTSLARSRVRMLAAAFWACVALAALTKGPPALVLLGYAVLAGKLLTGHWRASGVLRWWWGLPMVLAVVAAWLVAVWRVNPEHLTTSLWYNEIAGRVTGTGPEGAHDDAGPWYFFTSLPHMPYYFLTRMAPWSVFAILAIVHLWRRNMSPSLRNWRVIETADGRWLQACAILIVLTIAIFSLSTGKRADYIAACMPPAALLAAYWLLRVRADVANVAPYVGVALAAITIGAMAAVERRQPLAPSPNYGNEIRAFIRCAHDAITQRPLPVAFYDAGPSHLQAFLGFSEIDGPAAVQQLGELNQPCWIIEGPHAVGERNAAWLLRDASGREWMLTAKCTSEPSVAGPAWPGAMTLWLAEPK